MGHVLLAETLIDHHGSIRIEIIWWVFYKDQSRTTVTDYDGNLPRLHQSTSRIFVRLEETRMVLVSTIRRFCYVKCDLEHGKVSLQEHDDPPGICWSNLCAISAANTSIGPLVFRTQYQVL